ncbi:homospermidine synthase (spermidine-specific) [Abditibacterium utsteinense]|uniref:Homospermidine synthase (Spermidine-specific) n=1 Tax=Abditibacterium utsteinense TaxID=1960156 RepID=A0A2S8SWH8_9BACT|nr:deoxyhypusine synthase family protein [Abditibacterium utsteinense]PQV65155.1 homospermidine synthase (spermidine-specific) [Abditibacterium utsteinense]
MRSKSQRRETNMSLLGAPVATKPIDSCHSMHEAFMNLPRACGASTQSAAYQILYRAIVEEVPLVLTVSGIGSLSNQTRFWINSMVRAGYIAAISTTDALVYHDGHDVFGKPAKKGQPWERPVRSVDPNSDDGILRDNRVIRVFDVGFKEEVLEDQDRVSRWMFAQPEFQHPMTTTERNYRMGKIYHTLEKARGIEHGLVATCYEYGVPIFVGAPGDGSNSLGMLPLKMHSELFGSDFGFKYDPLQDVIESCAYHFWGLFSNPVGELGILIMGGGVPKNFALQPEPSLLQNFMLDSGKYEVRGYKYDLQITSAPVSDGSLSSCPPSEAVSWGKVDRDTFRETTTSVYGDYTQIFWPMAYSLFERKRGFEAEYQSLSGKKAEKYLAENPEARGLIRPQGAPRLFNQRKELLRKFHEIAGSKKNMARIREWYEEKPELLQALEKLRESGALDVGDV